MKNYQLKQFYSFCKVVKNFEDVGGSNAVLIFYRFNSFIYHSRITLRITCISVLQPFKNFRYFDYFVNDHFIGGFVRKRIK